uniref:Uncharacterized protein n=1 Tax=Arundo donax TaxID=35708 RepID=A0A0A9FMQ4_ARUDO
MHFHCYIFFVQGSIGYT